MKYKQSFALKLRSHFAAILAAGAAVSVSDHSAHALNTENDYLNASTSLNTPANWSLGHVPTSSEDATFGLNSISNATITGADLIWGSLDLTANKTISIINNSSTTDSSLTLSGGTGDSVLGANANDLIYVASGGTISISNGGTKALNLILGKSGNFEAVGTLTINSVISDGGNAYGITKTGAGTLTLGGADTYTGTTAINSGTVTISNTGSLASGNNVTFAGTGAFGVTGKTGGSTQTLGTLLSSAGDNTVTSTFGTVGTTLAIGTYTRSAGATTNFVVTNGANGSTNKITLGNVTPNTFISPGTFFGGSSYAFYDTGGFVRALDYTNDAAAANATTQTGVATALTTTGTPATQNAQYVGSTGTASTAASSTTASTTLPVAAGTGVNFAPGEAITGTGIANNTYVTAVTGDTLTLSANATVASGATVTPYNEISAQPTQTVNTLNLSGAGASVALASGATFTTNGILRSGEGATGAISTITGGTSVTAGGSTDFVIATPVSTDILTITTAVNTNGVLLMKSGLGTLNLNGVVSGNGGVVLNSGTLNLSGSNTYSGGTLLYGGSLGQIGNATAFGIGPITIGAPNSGNNISFAIGGSNTYANAITVNAGGQRYVYTAGSPTFTFSGPITLVGGANFSVGSGGGGNTETISGGITGTGNFISGSPAGNSRTSKVTLSGAAINMTGYLANNTAATLANGGFGYGSDSAAGSNTTVSAQIGANVTALYQNSATNTFILTGASNPFFGDTIVSAGTLNLRNSTTLQNSVVNFTGGAATFGTSTTVGLSSVTLGGLAGSGNVNLNNTVTATPGAVALTIGNSNASNGSTANPNTLNPVYSGILSDGTATGASVTKTGTNTQEFSGANTYTGGTTINQGKLRVTNTTGSATGTGDVGVTGSATTLSGTGFVTGNVNVSASGRLAPGTNTTGANSNFGAPNLLTLASGSGTTLSLNGANADFDLSSTAGGSNDKIATNALSLTGTNTFTFNELNGTLDTTNTYTLVNGSNPVTGFNPASFTTNFINTNGSATLYTPTYSTDGNNLLVSFAVVPEASTWAMMLGGFGTLIVFQRMRSRKLVRA